MEEDVNQIASRVLAETTSDAVTPIAHEKNQAAVALGKLGGLKGGKARAAALSPRRRKQIAKKAAKYRWSKKM